jgi:hypothetical protein
MPGVATVSTDHGDFRPEYHSCRTLSTNGRGQHAPGTTTPPLGEARHYPRHDYGTSNKNPPTPDPSTRVEPDQHQRRGGEEHHQQAEDTRCMHAAPHQTHQDPAARLGREAQGLGCSRRCHCTGHSHRRPPTPTIAVVNTPTTTATESHVSHRRRPRHPRARALDARPPEPVETALDLETQSFTTAQDGGDGANRISPEHLARSRLSLRPPEPPKRPPLEPLQHCRRLAWFEHCCKACRSHHSCEIHEPPREEGLAAAILGFCAGSRPLPL